ncbi:PIG-L deacetylase family protein [Actinomycetospora cinnamomea]|uniref:GlcNAc-PI de-N-acetylase n=1 Tax=Actinomycetospora cinnamomea TaxID=663609 RepID=A0A2U1FPW8_9PSEU|nr:PIG-L family deacetylase [Actinomycetospora cinnamomea]PVZ14186.1 GlcNAc-PI de-N-acetylase [Actinomycetospora cinnamomea]
MTSPLERLGTATASGARCVFLSPHLDDAVLSCGALMRALAPRSEIHVVTVFTATTDGPHTRAARSFLRQCGHGDATDGSTLFAARREEDRVVLDGLGVSHEHLGLPDALFRRRAVPRALAGPAARVARVLPELVHRYPTFRYDIALGRVSRGDRALGAALAARLEARLAGADLVFAPLGVGRHVDHLLTRTLGAGHPGRVVYYSDFPYDQSHARDEDFLRRHGLRAWRHDEGPEGRAAKADLIRGYATQADALFPSGVIPAAPETYFAA